MAYTTIDDPTIFFNTLIWTGNGASSRAISGLGFQPDWSWFKERSGAEDHILFDSDGFTVGLDLGINGNTETYVGWNWKAGTSFTNDASSTGIGSIDSAGSVNDTAGFSICTHTGTGSTATIKHGLTSAPKMIITKKRSATGGWQVGHESIGWGNGVYLNDTDASTGDAGAWNSTAPTSSIFTVGNSSFTNQSSATYVSYIFAEKKGYSKFGSYTGNGNADGTFVYTGFRPAMIIKKPSSRVGDWSIEDNKRNTGNVISNSLIINRSDAEVTTTSFDVDFVSNGFKVRATNTHANQSGETYIYMAFAESPFVNSNGAVPNNAR